MRLCKKCCKKGEKYPRKHKRRLHPIRLILKWVLLDNPTLVDPELCDTRKPNAAVHVNVLWVSNKNSKKIKLKFVLRAAYIILQRQLSSMSTVIRSVSAKAVHSDDAWKEIMGSQLTRVYMLPHTKVVRQWGRIRWWSNSLRSSIPCQQNTHLYQTYTLKLALQEVQFEVL